jgi:multiple sugar transport system permease protein
LPYAISATSVAVLWSFLLSPVGIINEGLRTIGLEALAKSWLITPPWHNIAMIIAYTWLSTGTNMILFLVGLQSIPTEPVEAAKIDGANGWQAFWKVIFPLLRPITTVVVTIAVVNGFKVFDLIWVMTQGGPYRSSETLALTMYREAFVSFRLGYGAAIAVILSLIVVFFSIFYLRSIFRRED